MVRDAQSTIRKRLGVRSVWKPHIHGSLHCETTDQLSPVVFTVATHEEEGGRPG